MIRADFITELKTEAAMRRKVWRRIPGSQAEFLDTEHVHRYRKIMEMIDFFDAMTDREFYLINERVDRQKKEKAAQSSLF